MNDIIWQQVKRDGCLGRRKVYLFDEVESTNVTAFEFGRDGVPSGSVVVADSQSKGRGRLGKSWQSPSGTGLYFSIILRPQLEACDLAKITLAVGLALCRAVEQVARIKAMIKWPNDLLIDGKKLAGILCESVFIGADPLVVLGVGLNINTPLKAFPEELQESAISLLVATGRDYGKGELLTMALAEIDQEIERLEKGKFEEILDEWKLRDATAGQWLTWITSDGKVVKGLSLGPDSDGTLKVRDSDGKVLQVLSGDIQLKVDQKLSV